MRKTKNIMAMPVILEIIDTANPEIFNKVFDFLEYVDQKFSTYKKTSEISKINRGETRKDDYSNDVKNIFKLAASFKKETNGLFDIQNIEGKIDPSGIVKGWAISEGTKIIRDSGFSNFYFEIAGDIQVGGHNKNGQKWRIGIKNPFKKQEIIKIISLSDSAIATSGNYERGLHIYNPKLGLIVEEIASISVIAQDILEADVYATAAFAAGKRGIELIAKQKNMEGYQVNLDKTASFTPGFEKYII